MILLSIFLNQLYFYVKTLGLKNVSNKLNKFLRALLNAVKLRIFSPPMNTDKHIMLRPLGSYIEFGF